jgi:MFS family permease
MLPALSVVVFFAAGLLASRWLLGKFSPRKVCFTSALSAALWFWLFTQFLDSLFLTCLAACMMGLSSGAGYFAPYIAIQMHLPDRNELVSNLVISFSGVGYCAAVLMPREWLSLVYFGCSVAAPALLFRPDRGLYKPRQEERMFALLVSGQQENRSIQVYKQP